MKKNVHALIPVLLAGLLLLVLSACSGQSSPLVCSIQISGRVNQPGVLSIAGASVNVYQDLASNPCGTCAYQPVHLYVGDGPEEAVLALKDQVERTDDLWKVIEAKGDTLVIEEKEAGAVAVMPETVLVEGLEAEITFSGREVAYLSEGSGQKDQPLQSEGQSQNSQSQNGQTGAAEEAEESGQRRLAAVYGPSYELLTALGEEEHIVVCADVQTDSLPWAKQVFRRITQLPELENVHSAVNTEELMTYNPEIVFTFNRQTELSQLADLGIAAVAGTSTYTLEDVKSQVRAYAAALNESAKARAETYCSYFDKKLAMIKERTKDLEDSERPRVYYAGTDILVTYGKYSDLNEVIEAAGGQAVAREVEGGSRVPVDYEQLMSWDPEYIFLDHGGMNHADTVEELRELLLSDPVYDGVTAVKREQVYMTPSGVFYWDMGLQKILLIEYMAKTIHPDLFEDLSMEEELMEFYQKFFGYDLTRDEAVKILKREEP